MPPVMRWLLGMEAAPDWASGGSWRLEVHSLPQGPWGVFCLVVAVASLVGVWLLYRREGRGLRIITRLGLCGLRLLILGSVAVMLLEVVVVLTRTEFVPSRLIVLLDTSESMDLKDPYPDTRVATDVARAFGEATGRTGFTIEDLRRHTRLELGQQAVESQVETLADGRQLFFYRFADTLEPLAQEVPTLKASGPATALGDAIRNVLAIHRGQPVAGILVVTDGQANTGEDPLKVAERMGRDGIPLVALATGTQDGPRNARLVQLETSPAVFVRDNAEAVVHLETRNLKSLLFGVTLEQRKEGGPWLEIGRQEILAGEDGVVQRVPFRFVPDALGQLEFRAQLVDVGPELSDDDNSATSVVRVVRHKIRVLLLAGSPGPEMQFLRNTLLRDEAMEFSCWLQNTDPEFEQPGHRPLRRLPVSQQELDRFDVVILFDTDVSRLGPTWPEMMTKFVGEAGGGLVYIAGELYSNKQFQATSEALSDNSWLKLLPVVRDPGLFQSTAEVQLSTRDTYTFELTPEGQEDPIFRFAADPNQNRDILGSLPGMYWHFPVTRAKPGATVLARHGDPRMSNSYGRHVLLATHLYGPGRAVFLGFDSTYRWRYLNEAYFDGFWARLVDRVGRAKVLGGRYPIVLTTDKSVYQVGEKVTINARAASGSDSTAVLSSLVGEMEIPGEPPQSLTFEPASGDPAVLQASMVAHQAGPWSARVLPGSAVDVESGTRAASVHFKVEPPRREFERPTVNQTLLAEMARQSNGRVFTIANVAEIPSAFRVKQVARTLEFRDETWDAPLLFGGIALLLTLEWILRKRLRMA